MNASAAGALLDPRDAIVGLAAAERLGPPVGRERVVVGEGLLTGVAERDVEARIARRALHGQLVVLHRLRVVGLLEVDATEPDERVEPLLIDAQRLVIERLGLAPARVCECGRGCADERVGARLGLARGRLVGRDHGRRG